MTKNNEILMQSEDNKLNLKKSHPTDAGWDLFSKNEVVIPSQEYRTVETGIRLQMPPQWKAEIRPRSGLAMQYGITLLNSPGTIENTYRGEIKVI